MPDEQTLEQILAAKKLQDEEEALRLEREKSIWDRINRGPRERTDELTARGWQDRYGITPDSGKLSKIFAGLGEVGRSITQGAKYKGIQDEARENALKEYQVEAGPLQRELGVISAERRAGTALQEKMKLEREKLEQRAYVQERQLGQSDEKLIQDGKFTREKINEIKANIGLIEARTGLVGEQTDAAEQKNAITRRFGGIVPSGRTGEAAAMQALGEDQPQAARELFALRQALAGAGKGGSGAGSGGGATTTTNRQVWATVGTGPDGMEIKGPVNLTSTSTKSGGGGGGGGAAGSPDLNAALPVWAQISQANPKSKEVEKAAQAAGGAPPLATYEIPGGKMVVVTPNPNAPPPKVKATIQNGRVVAAPAGDPTSIQAIARYFPNADRTSPDFLPEKLRGPNTILVAKRPKTAQEEAAEKAALEGLRVVKTGIDEFMSGNLELEVGLLGKPVEWARDLAGVRRSPSLFLETRSIQALNSYLNAISGLAVTKAEETRARKILPTSSDQPRTLMLKAFQGMMVEAQHKWLRGVGVPAASQAALFEKNPDLISLPDAAAAAALEHMDASRKAARNQQATYRLLTANGGYKDYSVKDSRDIIWSILTNVTEDMEEAFMATFPDGLGIGPKASAYKKGK
jgi:hypothetical protein